ncbi:MAG: HU family DNA-binding protein [Alistipes sp.]|jgi:nucleoid DNA-binding protein|uniref:HU family DNA-binding protein n=1 Tax=Butyricimonas hominis TaxID=2763032 RepID=UPI00351118AA
MNKKELIRTVSRELTPSVSQDKVALVLNKTVEIIKHTLDTGEPVKWAGFGSFVIKDIPSKRLYSPTLKKYIVTKGMRKIVFVEPRRRK